ncbi:heat shock 70 kDa protein 12B-like, partial [Ruditapes philippinarum]|uniref:heat shock 70 kDa protein 12B-like n=1 Tax=Ruditapes philippinarum TaxID=129788 RepID=UPI00295ABA84
PTKSNTKLWYTGQGTLRTLKTPTCALVNPDGKTLKSFGYDAENEYRELLDNGEDENYYFFKRFKMKLYSKIGKDLNRDMTIEDESGRQLLAANLFGMSVKFLVNDMLTSANKGIDGIIRPSEINLVLTVPAIWSDAAKQFMREVAKEAGICKEQLTIALEPEAASLYCRHLHIYKPGELLGNVSMNNLPIGTKYIVVDAGGGTIDVTVHETGSEHTLRELRPASGGDWGSIMIDKEFENLLKRIVGQTVFEKFKLEDKEDWLDMQREFESLKQQTVVNSEIKRGMKIPSFLIDLYNQNSQLDLCASLAWSQYAGLIALKRDKMMISNKVLKQLFDPSVTKTVGHLKSVLSDGSLKDVRLLLMVGGYSESPVLQHAVKEALPGIKVVTPVDASSVVLRGALIYGHTPTSISERILKYTYGTNYAPIFIEGVHPESKRFKAKDGSIRCNDVFSKLVTTGQIVKTGETQITRTYYTLSSDQKAMLCTIYASEREDPVYIDDDGCFEIGLLRIEFDEENNTSQREVSLSMLFGGTEIIVEVEDKYTGKKKITSVDFLG